ncbi:hypothetical protein NVS55_20590 [Myxococcus stipitatus]|uniref:hypothetical protein n=1 Tax=Myxococcus stipitatus TaxID=83455 RepID=UPI0031456094
MRVVTKAQALYSAAVAGDHQRRSQAIAFLDEELAKRPGNTQLLSMRAHLKDLAGDESGALLDHEQAIAREPCSPAHYYNRGVFHDRRGHEQDARRDFSRCARLSLAIGDAETLDAVEHYISLDDLEPG